MGNSTPRPTTRPANRRPGPSSTPDGWPIALAVRDANAMLHALLHEKPRREGASPLYHIPQASHHLPRARSIPKPRRSPRQFYSSTLTPARATGTPTSRTRGTGRFTHDKPPRAQLFPSKTENTTNAPYHARPGEKKPRSFFPKSRPGAGPQAAGSGAGGGRGTGLTVSELFSFFS